MYELKFNEVVKIAKDKNEIKRLVFLHMSGTLEFLIKTIDKLSNIDKTKSVQNEIEKVEDKVSEKVIKTKNK